MGLDQEVSPSLAFRTCENVSWSQKSPRGSIVRLESLLFAWYHWNSLYCCLIMFYYREMLDVGSLLWILRGWDRVFHQDGSQRTISVSVRPERLLFAWYHSISLCHCRMMLCYRNQVSESVVGRFNGVVGKILSISAGKSESVTSQLAC